MDSAYTTGTAINWSRGDVVQVWIESGGGSLNTVVKYRVNGGATTTLGTSGSPQASITGTTGNVDFLSYGAFAAYRLSSWVQAIRAYGYGKRPSWAR